MRGIKNAILTVCFTLLAIQTSGCESVDTATLGMKNKIAAIDLKMPDLNFWSADKSDDATDTVALREEPEANADEDNAAQIAVIDAAATDATCPDVSIIDDLGSMHQFTNPAAPDPNSEISSIRMTNLKTACKRTGNNLSVDMDIAFEGRLGPRARVWNTDKPSFAYPYFIAVTTPDGTILAKEVFAATVAYDKSQDTALHDETLRQIIPAGDASGSPDKILIGFQLTDDELAYNRSDLDMPASPDAPAVAAIEPAAGAEAPVAESHAPAVPEPKPDIAAQAAPVSPVEEEPTSSAPPTVIDITATD